MKLLNSPYDFATATIVEGKPNVRLWRVNVRHSGEPVVREIQLEEPLTEAEGERIMRDAGCVPADEFFTPAVLASDPVIAEAVSDGMFAGEWVHTG